jgi:hypothetical protein
MQRELAVSTERVKLFDPIFSEADTKLIEEYGFECLTENTVCVGLLLFSCSGWIL